MSTPKNAVLSSRFSTKELPAAQKYEAFRESIGVIFEVTKPAATGSEFVAEIDSHLLGDLMLVRCETRKQRFARTSRMIAQDGIDHYIVQLFHYGHTKRRNGDGEAFGGKGKIVLIDASQPWLAENNDFENLSFVVPRRALANKLFSENDHHGRMIDTASPFGSILADYMLSLQRSLGSISQDDALALVQPSTDLIAAALNHSARTGPACAHTVDDAYSRAIRVRVKQFIDLNLGNPSFEVGHILAEFNISRSQLYRIFAGASGISKYMRVRRLEVAYKKLLISRPFGQTVGEIAYSVGYKSETVFGRAFKHHFGHSPGDLRMIESSKSRSNFNLQNTEGRIWEEWFRTL